MANLHCQLLRSQVGVEQECVGVCCASVANVSEKWEQKVRRNIGLRVICVDRAA